jgi:hypothetical protein
MASKRNSAIEQSSSTEEEPPSLYGQSEGPTFGPSRACMPDGEPRSALLRSYFPRGELEAALAAAPEKVDYDYWESPYDMNDDEEEELYWANTRLALPGEPVIRRPPNVNEKTVADKLFVQKAKTIAVINDGPANAALVAELPAEKLVKKGAADLVIYFANSQMELEKQLPKVKERLEPKGALWVAYVKGTSKLRSDLHRDTIREYGDSIGLTSVAMIAIDDDWSALRLKNT